MTDKVHHGELIISGQNPEKGNLVNQPPEAVDLMMVAPEIMQLQISDELQALLDLHAVQDFNTLIFTSPELRQLTATRTLLPDWNECKVDIARKLADGQNNSAFADAQRWFHNAASILNQARCNPSQIQIGEAALIAPTSNVEMLINEVYMMQQKLTALTRGTSATTDSTPSTPLLNDDTPILS